jgi:hypothetical protein
MRSRSLTGLALFGGVVSFLLGMGTIVSVPTGVHVLSGPDARIPPEALRATLLVEDTTTTDDGTKNDVYIEPTYQDDTSQSYTFETEVTENTLEYVSCPFQKASGRVVIDFTGQGSISIRDLSIEANSTMRAAQRSRPTQVPDGVYEVRLASYANRAQPVSERGPQEQWRIQLFDSNAKMMAESRPIRDILDNETLVIELVDTKLTVPTSSVKAVAMHHAYPSNNANRFAPLCVSFDRVGDVVQKMETTEETQVKEVQETVVKEEKATLTYRMCPLPPREGRIIIDLTRGGTVPVEKLAIRANGDRSEAVRGPVMTFVPRGAYEVRYASYNGTLAKNVSTAESWHALLTDAGGVALLRLPPSRDIPDWQDEFVSKIDQTVEISGDATRLTALHTAYPAQDEHLFAPLCISFDPVVSTASPKHEDLKTETAVSVDKPIILEPKHQQVRVAHEESLVVDDHSTLATSVNVVVSSSEVGLATTTVPIRIPPTSIGPRRALVRDLKTSDLFDTIARSSTRERIAILEQLLALAADEGTDTEFRETADLSPALFLRPVAEVEYKSQMIEQQRVKVLARQNELRFTDSDGDGISDYDEIHIYGTDPHNSFTGGGLLTDGERLLLGLDPTNNSLEPIVAESPVAAGVERRHFFTIDEVTYLGDTDTTTELRPIRLSGTAEPHMFVTLYIFSMPVVVTVRTDAQGRFEYVHTEHLTDGSHQVYVATVNGSGNVLAKSTPFNIFKTAEAIELTPPAPVDDPVQRSLHLMLTLAFFVVLLTSILSVVFIGIHRSNKETEEVQVYHHE